MEEVTRKMLTSAQVQVVGFATEYGEFVCTTCADELLMQEGGDGVRGFQPVIQYEMDEYDSEASRDYFSDADGHADDCECTAGVQCSECANWLIEPWTGSECEELA